MNTMMLLDICLVIHLAGLTVMAGTVVSEYVVFRTFSKRLEQQGVVSTGLIDLAERFPAILGIGAAALILSGIGLFAITHGAFSHQLWFQVKMLLIVALVLNGFIFGGKYRRRLKEGIAANDTARIKSAAIGIQRFCLGQVALFLMIIILAVFKFN
jgi:uncharacterized membrane protein SirB2